MFKKIFFKNTKINESIENKSKWRNSVKKSNFKLAFIFFSPEGNEFAMPLATISAYVKQQIDGAEVKLFPVSTYTNEDCYKPEPYAETLSQWQPDLIAFSIMSPHWYPLDEYLSQVKKKMPDTPVLVGGYQAIMAPEQTIEHMGVDFVCVGDGEYPTVDLINYLTGKRAEAVPGLWEKLSDGSFHKTEAVQNKNLSDLPFPDYSIFEKNGTMVDVNASILSGPHKVQVLPAMVGRGCPYRCTYCCNTPLLESWDGNTKSFLRRYEPQAIVEHLCELRDRYNVGYFEFWDELFMSNVKFLKEFFPLYRDLVGVPFAINSRVEVMTDKFCASAADAGCHTIWFGLESGDETFRNKNLNRKMSNDQIIKAAENCRKNGINRITFNMVGMPFEKTDQMLKTLDINKLIAPEFFYFFIYIPLRGTPLYNTAKDAGLLIDKTASHYFANSDGSYSLNLKQPEGEEQVSDSEFNDICQQMKDFQDVNNRLHY